MPLDGDRHNIADHQESATGATGNFISPAAACKPALSPDTHPSTWSATKAPSWQINSSPQVLADLTSAGLSDISKAQTVRSKYNDTASLQGRISVLVQGIKDQRLESDGDPSLPEGF